LTGASGLIGSRLAPELARTSEVTAMGRRPPGDGTAAGIRWLRHDLGAPFLPPTLPPRVDTVVHLAQSPHFRDFPERAADIFEVNVGSTTRLLDWARRCGATRFVYASSGGLYGHGDHRFREDDAIVDTGPLGYYLASKRSAELLVEAYRPLLVVVILRFFFVYGPGQRASMLIPRLVRATAEGKPISLQGRDGIRVNPVHVDDAVEALCGAVRLTDSQRINVAGPDVLTLRQIAETIGSLLHVAPVFTVDFESHPHHLVGDITRMAEVLGAPRRRFADGVAELCLEG
jgi:nucleoside-diphosphate-sugar epimerase